MVEDKWSDKHYNFEYELSEEDIKKGKIKIDPYFVDKIWGIKNGCLFHILKTLARWGNKNTIERETKASIATLFRYAELENIDLKELCENYLKNNVQK